MVPNEYRFWLKSLEFWQEKAAMYLEIGDNAGFERCMARIELNQARADEQKGDVIIWGPEIYA